MTETKQHPESDSIDWDNYEETEHDRVWKNTSMSVGNQAVQEAAEVAAALDPDEVPAVLVNGGPYRGYDVSYRWKDRDNGILYIDYYSVRPGYGHVDEIIRDVEESLEENTEQDE